MDTIMVFGDNPTMLKENPTMLTVTETLLTDMLMKSMETATMFTAKSMT